MDWNLISDDWAARTRRLGNSAYPASGSIPAPRDDDGAASGRSGDAAAAIKNQGALAAPHWFAGK